jgi:GNAT superfamily N-acetyltransferase
LPKPRVPAEIMSAWLDLKPRWAQTVAQQAGDDIPFTVDPAEDLVEFSERVLREPDPRALMGRERAARKAFDARAAAAPPARPSLDELDPELPAPQALSNRDVQDFATGVQQELGPGLKNFDLYVDDQGRIGLWYLATEQGQGVGTKAMQRLTDFADQQGKPITLTPNEADAGVGTTSRARLVDFYRRFGFEEQPDGSMLRPPLPAPGDAGYISPDLLYALGLTGAGAAAGPLLSDSPAVGAIGGGLTGMLLAAARRNPRILSALSYSNILSGQAVPTSIAGNIGGAAAYAAEHPGAAGDVARHMLSPRLVADIKEGFGDRRLTATGRYQLDDETPNALTYASRALGSPDYATRSALQRAGATEREAGQYTLSGDPSSGVGNAIVNLARYPAVQWFMPVAKTAVNVAERGLERTPGLGSLDAVRGWSNASPELARRRQVLGALAMLGGAGVGYESGEGGSLDALPDWLSRYFGALTGPFALPTIAASAAGERFREASDQRDRYPALEALEAMATTGVRQLPLPAPWANPFDPAEFLRRMVPYGGAGRVLSPVPPREFDTSGDPLFGPALSQVPFLNEQLFERRGRPRR